jgi:hypothetical protein
MLSRFASSFRHQFSGTGKNGLATSLIPPKRVSPKVPRHWTLGQPAYRRLSPPCRPDGGDGHLTN